MNEIQILTTYNPFVVTGTVLSIVWALAYVLSWVVQLSWAWVDEAKVGSSNWVASKFIRDELKEGWVRTDGAWKYKKYAKESKFGTTHGYIDCTDFDFIAHRGFPYILIPPLIWFAMLCLNFWWISMWFAMFFAVAFTMRMARRGQKILTAHINDKDAHKEQSDYTQEHIDESRKL